MSEDQSWEWVSSHLRIAVEELESAQVLLDEMDVQHISENLKPYAEGIARIQRLAADKAADARDAVNIYIGATRAKLVAELRRCADQLEASRDGHYCTATIEAQANLTTTRRPVDLTFSNDDMEGRPEVENGIFVDIDGIDWRDDLMRQP